MATAAHAGPYAANQCAPSRFGSNLGCTANDVQINSISVVSGSVPAACVGGSTLSLDLQVVVNFGSNSRYDAGVFISTDGKDPQKLATSGGASTCNVSILPRTANPDDGDACGDGGNNQVRTFVMSNTTVPCTAAGNGTATLYIPYVITWDQQSGNFCGDNTYPVPGTTSKCNSGSVNFGNTTIVVVPAITKTANKSQTYVGDTLSYTIVITNSSGATLSGIKFTDPAVSYLTNYAVSCTAYSGGASCPTSGVNASAMRGSGISLPDLPNNSSLTFTVTATVTGSYTSPTAFTNTAYVQASGILTPSPATSTVTILAPPTVAKSFGASTIAANASTSLTITLSNPNSTAITGVAFTDAYPAGMKNTGTATTTCSAGTATAVVDGTSLSFSGGTIPANGSCKVTVNVTATAGGSYTNSTGSVTSGNAGTGSAATAVLKVLAPPTVTASFSPASIQAGGTSTLTVTFTNTNATDAVTGVAFTSDAYPANMKNSSTATTTCSAGTASATVNGTSLSFSGGTIPANGSCTVTVNVTASALGNYPFSTNTITTTNTGNVAGAGATLYVGALDHYELSLSGSSITCLPTTVTVTACADGSSPCTNRATYVDGTTAALTTSGGTLDTVNGNVTFNALGVASANLSYPSASDGTSVAVTLSGTGTAAANSLKCCQDGVCSVASNSRCSTTFRTAGFIFASAAGGASANLANQVAGVSSATYYLRAVRTNTTTQACETALTGTTQIDFAYECNDPASCYGSNLMSVNGGAATTVTRNDSGSVSSYQSVNMTFDANGNAPFTFNYADVGKVKLYVRKTVNSATLTGASNAFVVKPYGFLLSDIKCTTADAAHCGAGALAMATPGSNPAAADATGATFIRAGDPFSVTVTAVAAGNTTAPSFGRESAPEGVKLTSAVLAGLGLANDPAAGVDRKTTGSIGSGSTTLTVASSAGYAVGDRIRIAGAGVSGADLVTTVAAIPSSTSMTLAAAATTAVAGATVNYTFGAFANGVATGNNWTWGEVGVITLTPSIGDGDYLGAGDVTGTPSGNVGRFYPHHFGLSPGTLQARSDLSRTTGSISSGSSVLTVASAANVSTGMTLAVLGAGTAGAPLTATVNAVVGTAVTLSAAAANTVVGAEVYPYSAFTYMGEPMKATFTVTAYNRTESVTANYVSDADSSKNFAKLHASGLGTGASWFCTTGTQCMGLGAVSGSTGLTGRLAIDTASTGSSTPVSSWTAGVGSFAVFLTFSRPTTATSDTTWGPYDTLVIAGKPLDSDGVTLPARGASDTAHCVDLDITTGTSKADCDPGSTEANLRRQLFTTSVRNGRLWLANAYGSEFLPLKVPLQAQYWTGSGWAKSGTDSLTSLTVPTSANGGLVFYGNTVRNRLDAGEAIARMGAQSPASGKTSGTATLVASDAWLWLTGPTSAAVGPGKDNYGYVDIIAGSLGAPAWLPPIGNVRACFGSCGPRSPVIYLRERY